MTLLACLCTNNTAGCAPCAQSSRSALAGFEAQHPGAAPGQLVERAIAEHRADVVLGVLDREGLSLDINETLDPARHDSTTPLMTALQACDARIVELVSGRANFELDKSLALSARWRWAGTCSTDVVAAFLAIPGADPDAADASGMSLLHVVAVAGNTEAARLLLARAGIDVDNRNTLNGWTVLMNAVFAGHDDIAALLLRRDDLDINAADPFGNTALHVAALYGRTAPARLLLTRAEARVNGKDHIGRTPLSLAAFAGHAELVSTLLAHPAIDVNLVDRDRQTPLWWATAGKRTAIVRLLLADPRVDTSIANRPGHQTARAVAVELGLADLLPDLDRHAAAHPGRDQLSASDDYTERSYEPPPPTYIDPEPERPH